MFFLFHFSGSSVNWNTNLCVAALQSLYELDLTNATTALTAFLIGSALGILVGGIIADKISRHDTAAMLGVALASVILIIIGSKFISPYFVILALAFAGFFSGTTAPSRDMLIRKVTPNGASGRIFGFVYSGLDLGSSAMPLLAGALLDSGKPDILFYVCALMLIIAISTIRKLRKNSICFNDIDVSKN